MFAMISSNILKLRSSGIGTAPFIRILFCRVLTGIFGESYLKFLTLPITDGTFDT